MHKISYFLVLIMVVLFSSDTFAQYPSSYDLRTLNLVTPVKDQGSCGACWAFATCAAIESQWLKQGGAVTDLSEDNIIDCHGFDESPCQGGSFYMSQATLSLHKGIYSETIDPYTPSTQNCPSLSIFPPSPEAYVEDVLFIPSSNNAIKSALMTYGAVASTMYFTGTNYNGTTYKYYDSSIDAIDLPNAHCVTIVGWDDNMVFPGAPGNGGWIIKDSYGTSWANSGYFYCSYFDAGILTENAVFPVKYNIPSAQNQSYVYAHDEFGWVDNHGFSNSLGYALVKYVISPTSGNLAPQQIKRIGTYAIDDNMTIDIEIYRSKNGHSLSGLIASKSIFCSEKGFYTIPFNIKTDTIQSEIYIKTKYNSIAGNLTPIPIEKYEANHTSAFSASSNSCWISSTGALWNPIGASTSNNFDACIKMYTENAPYSMAQEINDSACVNSQINLVEIHPSIKDSVKWLVNGNFYSNQVNTTVSFPSAGLQTISLITFLGNNTDTATYNVNVFDNPPTPFITQNGNTINTQSYYAYQWLDQNQIEIPGAIQNTFTPTAQSIYFVKVYNPQGCYSISAPFNFIFADLEENEYNKFKIYPNPTTNNLVIENLDFTESINLNIWNMEGKLLNTIQIQEQKSNIEISGTKGVYIIEIQTKKSNLYFKIVKN